MAVTTCPQHRTIKTGKQQSTTQDNKDREKSVIGRKAVWQVLPVNNTGQQRQGKVSDWQESSMAGTICQQYKTTKKGKSQ